MQQFEPQRSTTLPVESRMNIDDCFYSVFRVELHSHGLMRWTNEAMVFHRIVEASNSEDSWAVPVLYSNTQVFYLIASPTIHCDLVLDMYDELGDNIGS